MRNGKHNDTGQNSKAARRSGTGHRRPLHALNYTEAWSYTGIIPSSDAKFGKNCVYFSDTNSRATVTNTTGMFNLSPFGNYEVECFIKPTATNYEALGYKFYDGHTFKLFTGTKTWTDGKVACEALGGHLATSTSAKKNAFLETVRGCTPVFLGARYRSTTSNIWTWITGEEWSYCNWRADSPDFAEGTDDVGLMLGWRGAGEWEDIGTTTVGYAASCICEWDYDIREFGSNVLSFGDLALTLSDSTLRLSSSTFGIDTSKQMIADNTSGYSYYGGHTFKYFNTALTWSEAKAACEAIGGHLATSTSAEKNTFLTTVTTNGA